MYIVTSGGRPLAVATTPRGWAAVANVFAACRIPHTMWGPHERTLYLRIWGI